MEARWCFPIRMRRRLAWELHASGMTLAEWNAIEALFEATSGMWQTFTFLDPTGNLLAQSEIVRGIGVDQWRADRIDDGDYGSVGDDAGDAGGERGVGAAGGGADSGCSGELCILPERLGANDFGIERDADDRKRDADLRIDQWMVAHFVIGEFGFERRIGDVRSAIERGRVGGFVRDAGGGATGAVGLQNDDDGRGSLRQRAIRGGPITVTAQGTDVYDAVIQIVNTEN